MIFLKIGKFMDQNKVKLLALTTAACLSIYGISGLAEKGGGGHGGGFGHGGHGGFPFEGGQPGDRMNMGHEQFKRGGEFHKEFREKQFRHEFVPARQVIVTGAPYHRGQEHIYFSKSYNGVISNYFRDHPFTPTYLPPGIAKNLLIGKPLPPGIAKYYLPRALLLSLPAYPGYDYYIVGRNVVLVDRTTAIIADILGVAF